MNVNPLSALSNALPSVATPARGVSGSFELNAREYGPVAATAISAVQLAGEAAESVCHFSTESLAKLGRGAERAVDGMVDTVEDGLEAVGDAAESVYDGATTAAQNIAGYATLGLAAGRRLVNELV